MSDIGFRIFYNIMYVSIIASILAMIILLFRKSFDKKISPSWKFAMWGLLLISLFIPGRITIQSQNTHRFIISSFVDQIENLKETLIANQSGKIILYIWIAGIIVIALYYIISSIVMKQKIGKNKVEKAEIIEILEQAKKDMGIQNEIELVVQNYKKVPCIYGFFKPKILLTEEILKEDYKKIYYIFMHELAHYKRKDILLNKVLILISVIHWFNPILWFCFKQIRQDMELKADEMVLNNINKSEEKEYAKTLVALLPISQEEREPARVLCVSDNKKNMERRINMIKLSEKFKEYKTLIGITTLLIVLCIGTFIFTRIKPAEEAVEEAVNHVQYFETPDRILFKEKNQDNYYVFTKESKAYTDLLNELINGIDSKENGQMVSAEEIKTIEQNENYIELDYDTISKNYIIAYEKEENSVIFRNDTGGQVVKQNLKNKEKLSKLLQEKIENNEVNCYHMEDSKEYKVKNEVPTETFIANTQEFRQYETGVYGLKVQSEEKLNQILQRYNIELEEEIPISIFEKTDVIVMLSNYDIEKIETRIGGLTYYFKGDRRQDSYTVNIFAASKAINTNCIYRNMDNITGNISYGSTNNSNNNNSNNTTSTISKTNSNATTTKPVDTTVRITKEQAGDIADEEAKKQKYQYQPWVSDFTSKNISYETGETVVSAELLYSLDEIHRLYYWEQEWIVKDSNGNNLYQGQPMWCVRLGDNNDPLTNLYIYVDATNGNILGAGKASD